MSVYNTIYGICRRKGNKTENGKFEKTKNGETMKKRYILLDLDGTVTDSGRGIRNGVQYTLRRYGIEETDVTRLNRFIGPPLPESLRQFYGIDEPNDMVLESIFREYYSEKGIFENEVYAGIPDCLGELCAGGCRLYIATSKPQFMAEKVLDHFGLTPWFSGICGADRNLKLVEKADVLKKLLTENPEIKLPEALMIGDRKYDVLGAAAVGIPAVGVLWGYGTREELERAGAFTVVDTPSALSNRILSDE